MRIKLLVNGKHGRSATAETRPRSFYNYVSVPIIKLFCFISRLLSLTVVILPSQYLSSGRRQSTGLNAVFFPFTPNNLIITFFFSLPYFIVRPRRQGSYSFHFTSFVCASVSHNVSCFLPLRNIAQVEKYAPAKHTMTETA